jgi:5'-nucleotidase
VEDVTRERFKQILENAVSRVEFTDGRFAQVAGFTFEYDPNGQAQIIDTETGVITQEGTRVLSATLDGGEPIVTAGQVVPGPALNVALNSFSAAGGDQYPVGDLPSTNLGVTYQQVLERFIEDPIFLDGLVTAADYPAGGEGRITTN